MRRVVGCGVGALAAAVLIIFALHVVGPGASVSPVWLTISEYGLTDVAWVFAVAVLLGAAGAGMVTGAALWLQVRAARVAGVGARLPVAAASIVLAVAGLVVVALVHKTDWAVGPSVGGTVHRVAGLVAFLALPVAIVTLCLPRVGRTATTRCAMVLAAVSPGWLVPIVIAVASATPAWWLAVPLGLLERGMAMTEVAAVLLLAAWTYRSAAPDAAAPDAAAPDAGAR